MKKSIKNKSSIDIFSSDNIDFKEDPDVNILFILLSFIQELFIVNRFNCPRNRGNSKSPWKKVT